MNTIDVIVGLLLAYSLFRGITKGFVIEISGMIALFLGIMGAFKFSSYIGKYLSSYVDWNPKIIQAVSFILLFIGIIYAISLTVSFISSLISFEVCFPSRRII